MKGLEVSEVRFSEVLKADDSFRTDAEFFSKKDLILIEQLQRLNFRKLKDVVNKIDVGFVGTMKNHYTESQNDPILLQTKNINEFTVGLDDVLHIDSDFHHELNKSQIHKGNVLIARSGSFGKASIWLEDYVVNSSDIIIVECSKEINPYYVVAFLNSEFGKTQLFRFASGGLQGHVNLTILENLIIPLLSSDFQSQIASFVKSAHTKLVESKSLYAQAEDTLLCELGLKDWQPKTESVSIKTFSDFASSGRLDAEFYQQKYDELEGKIKSVPYKAISELQTFNARGVQPDYISNGSVSVVNSKHILENGLDYENFEKTTTDFLKDNEKAAIKQNDILIYTTGANIGRTQPYLLSEPAIASNHVNILRLNEVNPLYAAFVLNSKIGRLQTEKACTGSAQAELYPSDIENFLLPILSEKTQDTIANLIQKSFELRAESKQLLEQAKQMVEAEIEK